MKTILFILGTRPEAIKLAPIILELKKNSNKFNVKICNTEQQKELSNQTLLFFGLVADYNLDIMMPNQTLNELQAKLLEKLSLLFDENKFDATIVQGDTMSVFCGALTSFYYKIPVFHVEAGLRSYNNFEPFPEEAIRQMVSRITDLHFVPTKQAFGALEKENINKEKIILTGNTVIDSLSQLSQNVIDGACSFINKFGINLSDDLVLITVHRRENHGKRLEQILNVIKKLALEFSTHQFIIPVHPNPNVKEKVYTALDNIGNIILFPPLDYPVLVQLMQKAKLILTDSGGIQEEAPTFGTPLLVMRYETERNEGVDAGFAKLVGADENIIYKEAKRILSQSFQESRIIDIQNPYGDGFASKRIRLAIEEYFHE